MDPAWSHTEGNDDDDDDDDDGAVPVIPLPQLLHTVEQAKEEADVEERLFVAAVAVVAAACGRPRVCDCLALDRLAVAQSLLAIHAIC